MTVFTLVFLMRLFTAFAPEQEVKGTLNATVDGRPFALAEGQMMRGVLVNKEGSMDGRTPARTVISVNFTGATYKKADQKDFTEMLETEIGFDKNLSGTPGYYYVGLSHQSTTYFLLNETSKMNVTQMVWAADKKSFRLFADFDCKMRSFGYPNDGKKDVSLKGKISNIRITVPSWIAAKL